MLTFWRTIFFNGRPFTKDCCDVQTYSVRLKVVYSDQSVSQSCCWKSIILSPVNETNSERCATARRSEAATMTFQLQYQTSSLNQSWCFDLNLEETKYSDSQRWSPNLVPFLRADHVSFKGFFRSLKLHVFFLLHENSWKMRKEGDRTNSYFTTPHSYTYLYSRLFSKGVSIWALTDHDSTGMKRCLLGICKKALVERVPGATIIPHTLRHWQITQTIFSLKTERKVGRRHTACASLVWVRHFKHRASVWW